MMPKKIRNDTLNNMLSADSLVGEVMNGIAGFGMEISENNTIQIVR
jgi:hypothetical protein